ncbi:RagB/SusD family nutrient uptake outer membrane protein [Polluticaenibacter yanchengensis]|uniref:RagB/SusD family nutrient uptake outer membrane protein n=1 Tax=Polluticaenibacter yanchengensis TaxID=3014562 RepID=A0ABT4UGU4_9BACT|nr:RagB/SusD family nutrient uptake outer membrane protein [Chitinophagaceae bacterium LY-5]
MKKNKLLIYTLFAAIAFTSCKKELYEEPFNAISDDAAFSTPDRIDKSAVGMYDALQNANYFSGRILIYADIRGIDANPNNFFGQMNLFNTLTAADATVASAYQGAYRTIYEANLFVKNFTPKASLVTAEKANQYLGEAKYIRSLCYFYLVNLWAQPYDFTADASHLGIPLVLEAASDPFATSNNIARSTVKQVYDQLEADLLDAEAKLPLTNTDAFTRVARATKGAARALLMRLYLYKKDYTKALQYANTIISSGIYALRPSPEVPFRNYLTTESIFSVAFNGGDNPNTNNAIGQHYGASKRGDISVADEYLTILNMATDKRFLNLIEKVGTNYWTTKYNAGTTDYVPVSRYAEVLLTKAEALARNTTTGVNAEAVGIINNIRSTSGADNIAPATRDDLINLILRERRIELAFEGHGILEFLRTRRSIPAHSIVPEQAWGSNYVVFPIPKYDMDKNPNLVPNPGY